MVYPSNYQVLRCKLWTRETFERLLSADNFPFFSRTKTLPCPSCSFRLPHIDHERLQVAFITRSIQLGLDPSSAGCTTLGAYKQAQRITPWTKGPLRLNELCDWTYQLNIRYWSILSELQHTWPTTRLRVWRLDSGQGVLIWLNNKWWNWTYRLNMGDIKILLMLRHNPSYVIAEHLANNEAQGTLWLNT